MKPPRLEEAIKQALAARPELAESDISIAVNMLDDALQPGGDAAAVDAFANLTAVRTGGHSCRAEPGGTNPL